MQTKSFEVVRALVDRERNQVRVDVPEHELSVLRAIHGPQAVKIIERDVDDVDLDPSAEAEFDRLTRAYKRTGAADPVLATFRNGPVDLERFGFKSGLTPLAEQAAVIDQKQQREARKKERAARKAA